MKPTVKIHCAPRLLPVLWIDDPEGHWTPGWRNARAERRSSRFVLKRGVCQRSIRRARAFTILELMVVLAIIGFIAALALPHVSGFNTANAVNAATRQLLDDVAYARQKAMATRSTVYMVFVPPGFYNSLSGYTPPYTGPQQAQQYERQITNLLTRQYTSYALLATRSVGDQPGRHYPHYLTDWRTLPQGVYFTPFQFGAGTNGPIYTDLIYTTNTLSGTVFTNLVPQFNWAYLPFPSVEYGASYPLPYIGFTSEGSLTPAYTNQYIMLTRGSVLYAQNSNTVSIQGLPILTETPPGNATNNPCMVQIDWLTGRANIVQNQFK